MSTVFFSRQGICSFFRLRRRQPRNTKQDSRHVKLAHKVAIGPLEKFGEQIDLRAIRSFLGKAGAFGSSFIQRILDDPEFAEQVARDEDLSPAITQLACAACRKIGEQS